MKYGKKTVSDGTKLPMVGGFNSWDERRNLFHAPNMIRDA